MLKKRIIYYNVDNAEKILGKAEWIILPPEKPTFILTKLCSESSEAGKKFCIMGFY